MKKLLSIFLVAVMVIACLPVTAFAAGSASFSASTAYAKPGETVAITVDVSADGEFSNYEVWLEFDESVLKIVSGSGATIGTYTKNDGSLNPNHGKVAYAVSENVSSHSFTVNFEVAENASSGTYPVSLSVDFVSDADLEDLDCSTSAGAVIIEAPAHEHAWDEGKVTTEPTCTEDGVMTYTCECGETKTEAIPALGHKWGEWSVVGEVTSCDDDRTEERVCSVCGEKETRTVEGGQHTWGEWEVTKEATCTEAGVETRICSACKETESREIAMIDHEFGAWTFCGTEDKHEHEMVCSMCGKAIVAACNDVKVGENKEDDKIIEEWQCVDCGHTFIIEKDLPDVPVVDPNLDDVPKTGDITTQVVMTGAAALVAMMAAVAFIFKRKAAK